MGIIELGGIASGLVAIVTLTSKIVKLITTIQSLINRIDQLQQDMATTVEKYVDLDQRVRLIEYELTPV